MKSYIYFRSRSVISLLKTGTTKNILIVFLGGILNSGMGFIVSVLVSRTLEPEGFGLYSIAILILSMASQLVDLGMNSGIVQFGAPLVTAKDNKGANQVLFISLIWKSVAATLTFGLIFFLAQPLAELIFHKPTLFIPLRWASIGVFGALLYGFIGALFQTYNRFDKKVITDFIVGFCKLGFILILVNSHSLSITSGIIVYSLAPLLGLVIGFLIGPKGYLQGKWDWNLAKKIFSFSKWITISTICTIFLSRMELLILSNRADSYSIGIYSAATQLASIVSVLLGAITLVLYPKVVALKTIQQMKDYAKTSIISSLIINSCILPVFFFSKPIIGLIFGSAYVSSVPFFNILLIAYMISMVINPISLLLFALNKPAYLTMVNVVQLPVSVAFNIILINKFGAIGAAYTAIIIRVLATIIIGYGVIYFLSDKAKRPLESSST